MPISLCVGNDVTPVKQGPIAGMAECAVSKCVGPLVLYYPPLHSLLQSFGAASGLPPRGGQPEAAEHTADDAGVDVDDDPETADRGCDNAPSTVGIACRYSSPRRPSQGMLR